MQLALRFAVATLALAFAAAPTTRVWAADEALAAALRGSARTAAHVKRDPVRHPAQELEFFGLRPDQTVVEINPGNGYWTEILAPYLKTAGTLYVAVPSANDPDAPEPGKKDPYREKLAADLGVDVKATNTDGRSALDAAKALKYTRVVKFLLEKGVK